MTSSASGRVGVAVIGAGAISDEYLTQMTSFPDLDVLVVADLDVDRARAQAEKYGIPGSGGIDAALQHPDVEIVANLTIPAAHVEVSTAILQAGKHAWTEKPLALDRAGGRALLELAAERGLRLGSAPDTILGRGLQAARRAIDSGVIGQPVSAITMMQDPGPESWHPSPEFIYAKGGGPLWDRGPYYLAMLTHLFGPMRSVAGLASTTFPERTIATGPKAGTVFPVEVPTSVSVLTEFAGGQTAQSTYSFESALVRMGFVEISGTEGTLAIPDPNRFDGDLYLFPSRQWTLPELQAIKGIEPDRSEWKTLSTGAWPARRGSGILDMARGLRTGAPHRATGEFGYHVLDGLIAIIDAVESRSFVELESTVAPPELLPESWDPYASTL